MAKYFHQIIRTAAMLLIVLMLLPACQATVGYAGNNYSWNGKGKMNGTYKTFNGTEQRKIKAEAGETIAFDYDSSVRKGSLSMKLLGPDGRETATFKPGENGKLDVKSEEGGTYKLVVEGQDTGGSFHVSWEVKE